MAGNFDYQSRLEFGEQADFSGTAKLGRLNRQLLLSMALDKDSKVALDSTFC